MTHKNDAGNPNKMAGCEGLPFFLRECKKVPPLPFRRFHVRWRSFELAVSLEALLHIDDAIELLFRVASNKFKCPGPSRGKKGNVEHRNVIWLFEDIFIVVDWFERLKTLSLCQFTIELEGQRNVNFTIFKMPSADVKGQPFVDLSSLLATNIASLMDILFSLLAKHKSIKCINIGRVRSWNPNEPFPVSLDALKVFVSEAQSFRRLSFDSDAGFSREQWRVIAFNCNPCVTLYDAGPMKQVLIDAMKCNMCPTNLRLLSILRAPPDVFREFLDALGSTTSLKCLELAFPIPKNLVSLCGAIARNRGLQTLKLTGVMTLLDTNWEFVWHSLASHPTLQSLHVHAQLAQSSLSQERDQIMIRCISSNPVLCAFTCPNMFCFHNYDNVMQTVRPFLELNRVRPVVKAIKQQQTTDDTLRHKLFAFALLSDHVSKRPACRFWLLQQNSDILAQLSGLVGRRLFDGTSPCH